MSLSATLLVSSAEFTLDLSLDVSPGRTLALLGPNGAGKSTALAALAGTLPYASEDRKSDGKFGLVQAQTCIRLNGRLLDEVPVEKRRIGFVFQDYLLFPHLTVLENVAFGATRQKASEWLERLGIDGLAQQRPRQLSGGQAQRVALARALATSPDLLLLDEPLAALDVEIRDEVRAELRQHLKDWGGLTIVVTHSFEDVAALADDVVVVEKGLATQRGEVRDVVRAPATAYVERLVRDWSEDG